MKEKNELENIIEKYFSKENSAVVFYDLDQEKFNKIVENIKKYERPDMIGVIDNEVIAIEHFEFDSYSNDLYGSIYKKKEGRLNKEFRYIVSKNNNEKRYIKVQKEINENISMKNYINNFSKIFKDHYIKIEDYIENINQTFDANNLKKHICFFAEDVTPFGNFFLDKDEKYKSMLPMYSKKIMNILRNSPKIEYLILGFFNGKEYKIAIFKNTIENIERFEKENGSLRKDKLVKYDSVISEYLLNI